MTQSFTDVIQKYLADNGIEYDTIGSLTLENANTGAIKKSHTFASPTPHTNIAFTEHVRDGIASTTMSIDVDELEDEQYVDLISAVQEIAHQRHEELYARMKYIHALETCRENDHRCLRDCPYSTKDGQDYPCELDFDKMRKEAGIE